MSQFISLKTFHTFKSVMLAALLLPVHAAATETTDSTAEAEAPSVQVSLITCSPGRDIYELCGHTALRVRSGDMDMAVNYGIFDFNAPNFVYRFVKGETDYMVAAYPFEHFMEGYQRQGRSVTEQPLNLTSRQADSLIFGPLRRWPRCQALQHLSPYNGDLFGGVDAQMDPLAAQVFKLDRNVLANFEILALSHGDTEHDGSPFCIIIVF